MRICDTFQREYQRTYIRDVVQDEQAHANGALLSDELEVIKAAARCDAKLHIQRECLACGGLKANERCNLEF